MIGQVKNCNVYANRAIVEQYINDKNPYENRNPIGIDLLALTRYAKANNKKPEELQESEIDKFRK